MSSISSDALYRLLVQGVTDYAIYMLSVDGIVGSWNAGAERAKGYTAEEIVGKHFSHFYIEEDRNDGRPQRALDTAKINGKFEGEGWRVRKDGTRFWAHVVIDSIFDEAGQLIGFAKITRDRTESREAQRVANEQQRNFQLLVQGVTDYAIYMLAPNGTVSNWNTGAERAKGYRADEIVGKHFSQFYTPDDRRKGLPQRALATALSKGKFEGQGWRLRRDGSRFWAHVIIDPIRNECGELIGFAKITRDMSEYKKQMDEIGRIRENLDLALSNMSQGLCLFNAQEELLVCNARFREILGLEAGVVEPGATFVDVLWALNADPDIDPQKIAAKVEREREEQLARLGDPSKIITAEQVWRGRTIAVNHRSLPTGGWVSTMDDITERRQIEERIVYLAHYDSLTELPNRAAFQQKIEEHLDAGTLCSLLYLDLDRFKLINDTLGHLAGDEVLQRVAGRIGAQLRRSDFGARLGGDEFAVLLTGSDGQGETYAVADRLIRDLSRPFRVAGTDVRIGASIGIAFPADDVNADTLLRNADLALYSAKDGGKGRYCCYEEGMEAEVLRRRALENDLRQALANNEFLLHYQPVVDTRCNVVTSFEALLRWESPSRGKVAPVNFIPFAEDLGLMPEIGDWVLRTACKEALTWPADICVSVNVSATQFKLPNLVARTSAILAETGLPPERLELEITETAMISDVAAATKTLNELRAGGIKIALDDFGTGYSSLSFLRSLPFTRIKIDKSFLQDLGSKPQSGAIIRAVTEMCTSLGVTSTVEGVETEEQLTILSAEGCREIQGYLISKPGPAPVMKKWLDAYHGNAVESMLSLSKNLTSAVSETADTIKTSH